jgi:ATP-dependent protease Clp ATPase subunit
MIIPFVKPEPQEQCCSFCKKPKSQVRLLISPGDGAPAICNACVAACNTRLAETAANQVSES